MNDKYDEIEIELPLGYLLHECANWDEFCDDTGLNPWVINEGLACSEDTYSVKIGLLRKHGVLR